MIDKIEMAVLTALGCDKSLRTLKSEVWTVDTV